MKKKNVVDKNWAYKWVVRNIKGGTTRAVISEKRVSADGKYTYSHKVTYAREKGSSWWRVSHSKATDSMIFICNFCGSFIEYPLQKCEKCLEEYTYNSEESVIGDVFAEIVTGGMVEMTIDGETALASLYQ
jgi:hypothetical protein